MFQLGRVIYYLFLFVSVYDGKNYFISSSTCRISEHLIQVVTLRVQEPLEKCLLLVLDLVMQSLQALSMW